MANDKQSNWKRQFYLVGASVGSLLGFLTAYMYTREVENAEDINDEERPELPPATLLGLAVSVITVIRQIAEAGSKSKNRKK